MDNDNALKSIKTNLNKPKGSSSSAEKSETSSDSSAPDFLFAERSSSDSEKSPEVSSVPEAPSSVPEEEPEHSPIEEPSENSSPVEKIEVHHISDSEPEPEKAPEPETKSPSSDSGAKILSMETESEPVVSVPEFDPEAPRLSTEPKKKKSGLLVFLIIIFVLFFSACAASYYVVVLRPDLNPFQNFFNQSSSTSSSSSSENTTNPSASLPEEEVEISLEEEKTLLFKRLFSLHSGADYDETFNGSNPLFEEKAYFAFDASYNVTDALYSGNLSASDRIYIVTKALHAQDKLKPLSELGISEEAYISAYPDNSEWYSEAKGIEQTAVASLYKDIFGKTIRHQDATEICGSLTYSSELKAYITRPEDCGGIGVGQQLYVISYTQKGTEYYVNVAITDKYDGDQAPIEQLINSGNTNLFPQYRFTFEQAEGNYYFTKVEPLPERD